MLTRLLVNQFVIARRLEIEFSGGFCVLTGETGAGKSLLVGALALLAGGRAAPKWIAPDADSAEVAAAFTLDAHREVEQYLQENDLQAADDEPLLVRRVIGRRRAAAYINGRQVPLAQLTEVMAQLIDICGQHAHYSLLAAAAQRQLLDARAGTTALAEETAAAFAHWRKSETQRREAEAAAADAEKNRAMLEEMVAELHALNFSDTRWQEMNDTLTRTAALGDLSAACTELMQCLQGTEAGGSSGRGGSDDSRGAQALLSQAHRLLSDAARHDARLAEHLPALNDADALINEVARAVAAYADNLQADPQAEQQADAFVAACHRAARKYGVAAPDQLGAFIAEKEAALAAITDTAAVEKWRQQESAARQELERLCRTLTTRRKRAALAFAREVNALLKQLAMPKAKLSIVLAPTAEPTAHGSETVALHITTRPDMPAGGIADVASGGELSRLGLALQLAARGGRGSGREHAVSVFDEVDAGIGGSVAATVGALLRRLGGADSEESEHTTRQVLCVTHLPQVAAQANAHWRVDSSSGALTVQRLDEQQRVEEIARMHSGEKITDTARRHARELLRQRA